MIGNGHKSISSKRDCTDLEIAATSISCLGTSFRATNTHFKEVYPRIERLNFLQLAYIHRTLKTNCIEDFLEFSNIRTFDLG